VGLGRRGDVVAVAAALKHCLQLQVLRVECCGPTLLIFSLDFLLRFTFVFIIEDSALIIIIIHCLIIPDSAVPIELVAHVLVN